MPAVDGLKIGDEEAQANTTQTCAEASGSATSGPAAGLSLWVGWGFEYILLATQARYVFCVGVGAVTTNTRKKGIYFGIAPRCS